MTWSRTEHPKEAFDWNRRTATLGTWLRKPFWGQGYSGERAARMLELAFDRRKEGRIRNDVVIDGEPHDSIRYSIARKE